MGSRAELGGGGAEIKVEELEAERGGRRRNASESSGYYSSEDTRLDGKHLMVIRYTLYSIHAIKMRPYHNVMFNKTYKY